MKKEKQKKGIWPTLYGSENLSYSGDEASVEYKFVVKTILET